MWAKRTSSVVEVCEGSHFPCFVHDARTVTGPRRVMSTERPSSDRIGANARSSPKLWVGGEAEENRGVEGIRKIAMTGRYDVRFIVCAPGLKVGHAAGQG